MQGQEGGKVQVWGNQRQAKQVILQEAVILDVAYIMKTISQEKN